MNKLIEKYLVYYRAKLKEEQENSKVKGKRINHTYNETISKLTTGQNIAKVCIFCGNPFTIEAVNDGCPNNRTYKMNPVYPNVDWESIVPNDLRGSKQHYWYVAGELHRKRPDLSAHSMIRKTMKKHYFNNLSELENIKFSIRKYEIEAGKDL